MLKVYGISTIGQLAKLPPESARRILGDSGMSLYRHANGIDNRKISLPGDARSISRETTLQKILAICAHYRLFCVISAKRLALN